MRMHHKLIGISAIVCGLTCTVSDASAQVTRLPTSRPSDVPSVQSPTFPPSDLLLSEGHTLYKAGRYKEAAASFERALQAGVKKPHEAALEVARSYEKLGNHKQARRWTEISVQLADAGSRSRSNAARALPSSMPAPPVMACATHPAEEVQWLTRPRRTPTEKSRSRKSWTTSSV